MSTYQPMTGKCPVCGAAAPEEDGYCWPCWLDEVRGWNSDPDVMPWQQIPETWPTYCDPYNLDPNQKEQN